MGQGRPGSQEPGGVLMLRMDISDTAARLWGSWVLGGRFWGVQRHLSQTAGVLWGETPGLSIQRQVVPHPVKKGAGT